MKVERIGAFCNTINLHLAKICLENQFLVLRVAILRRFYCKVTSPLFPSEMITKVETTQQTTVSSVAQW